MKFAKSIKFGGLLISAKSCDQNSYLRLGLVCPVCHSPVFLVSGFHRESYTRKSKLGKIHAVKACDVENHFSHFDNSQDESCLGEYKKNEHEYKSAQTRARSEIRAQSLKLFNKYIWAIIATSKYIEDVENHIIFIKNHLKYIAQKDEKHIAKLADTFHLFWKRVMPCFEKSIIEEGEDLQHFIALEAMKYLSSKPGARILEKLFFFCAARLERSLWEEDEKRDFPLEDKFKSIMSAISALLFEIDWIDIFDSLEKGDGKIKELAKRKERSINRSKSLGIYLVSVHHEVKYIPCTSITNKLYELVKSMLRINSWISLPNSISFCIKKCANYYRVEFAQGTPIAGDYAPLLRLIVCWGKIPDTGDGVSASINRRIDSGLRPIGYIEFIDKISSHSLLDFIIAVCVNLLGVDQI